VNLGAGEDEGRGVDDRLGQGLGSHGDRSLNPRPSARPPMRTSASMTRIRFKLSQVQPEGGHDPVATRPEHQLGWVICLSRS
jgi:hypothetical protein